MTIEYQYQLPTWSLCPLVNGDYTGLTEVEEIEIEKFEVLLIERHGNFTIDCDDEPYFSWHNDINGLGSEIVEVTLWGEK